jgi:hypothetical protein
MSCLFPKKIRPHTGGRNVEVINCRPIPRAGRLCPPPFRWGNHAAVQRPAAAPCGIRLCPACFRPGGISAPVPVGVTRRTSFRRSGQVLTWSGLCPRTFLRPALSPWSRGFRSPVTLAVAVPPRVRVGRRYSPQRSRSRCSRMTSPPGSHPRVSPFAPHGAAVPGLAARYYGGRCRSFDRRLSPFPFPATRTDMIRSFSGFTLCRTLWHSRGLLRISLHARRCSAGRQG